MTIDFAPPRKKFLGESQRLMVKRESMARDPQVDFNRIKPQ